MGSVWPEGFERVPDDEWTRQPVRELARAYDTVEQHGWYDNLDPTVDGILAQLDEGDVLMDYSGGTGILVDRLLAREPGQIGILNVDSSPKFLRLCLEKFHEEPRVAMRRLPYLDEEQRLAYPDEVIGQPLVDRGIQAITSTNAIHLYYDLPETLASWRRLLTEDGRAFVQSGNVDREDRPSQLRIIDQTVEAVDEAARAIVAEDDELAIYRQALADEEFMREHEELRDSFFLPPRDRSYYEERFAGAGFELVDVAHRAIPVDREEWARFLEVYHQGVLGWVGGAEKVTEEPTEGATIADRKRLIRRGLERVLDGRESFEAEWTYWTLAPT